MKYPKNCMDPKFFAIRYPRPPRRFEIYQKMVHVCGSLPFLGSAGGGLLSFRAHLTPAQAALGGDALLWGDWLDGGGSEAGFAGGGRGGGKQLVLLLVLPTRWMLGNFLPLLRNQRSPQPVSHYHTNFDILRSYYSIYFNNAATSQRSFEHFDNTTYNKTSFRISFRRGAKLGMTNI